METEKENKKNAEYKASDYQPETLAEEEDPKTEYSTGDWFESSPKVFYRMRSKSDRSRPLLVIYRGRSGSLSFPAHVSTRAVASFRTRVEVVDQSERSNWHQKDNRVATTDRLGNQGKSCLPGACGTYSIRSSFG